MNRRVFLMASSSAALAQSPSKRLNFGLIGAGGRGRNVMLQFKKVPDVNIAAIIEYAVDHLEIPDIVICGHYNCGGIQALEDGVESHYIADWLLIGNGAKERVDRLAQEQTFTREEKLRRLVEENVRLQIKHLSNLSLIKHRRPPARIPHIHGWVYCMATGHIKVLVDGRTGGGA